MKFVATLALLVLLLAAPAAGAAARADTGVDHFAVTAVGGGALGSQTAGQPFAVEVTAEDSGGNPVAGYAGSVDLSSNGTCSAGCSTAMSGFSNGSATATITLTHAGSASVTATEDGGSATGTSASFAVAPAAPSTLAYIHTSKAHLAEASSRALTAEILDAYGNAVTGSGDQILFAHIGGHGSVTGLGLGDAATGIASVQIQGNLAGPVTVEASADVSGVRLSTTLAFLVVHGPATRFVFWQKKLSTEAPIHVGHSKRLRLRVEDAAGNLVRNKKFTAQFTAASATGTLSGLPVSVTSSGGLLSCVVRGTAPGRVGVTVSGAGLSGGTVYFTVLK